MARVVVGGHRAQLHQEYEHLRQDDLAEESAPSASCSPEEVALLLQRVQDLEEENGKLRVVEDQFWALLSEREELTKRLHRQGAHASSTPQGPTTTSTSSSNPSSLRTVQLENERLSAALRESLDLLIAREVGGAALAAMQGSDRGPVGAFLVWCDIECQRSAALNTTPNFTAALEAATATAAAARSATGSVLTQQHQRRPESGGGDGGATPSGFLDEKETLRGRIRELENTVSQLQVELDRADVSRLQALDDAERAHSHVATLSQQVRALNQALADQAAASRGGTNGTAAGGERRPSSSPSAGLAADTARIRREMSRRSEDRTDGNRED